MSDVSNDITLPLDTPCSNCAYDLVGLPTKNVCPECGYPILKTLHGDLLRFEPIEARRSLGRWARCIGFAWPAMLRAFAMSFIIVMLFPLLSFLLGSSARFVVMLDHAMTWFFLLFLVAFLASALILSIGLWRFGTAAARMDGLHWPLVLTARVTLFLSISTMLVYALMSITNPAISNGWPFFAAMMLFFLSFGCVTRVAANIAWRLPDPNTAKALGRSIWMIVVSAICVFVLPIFGIKGWALTEPASIGAIVVLFVAFKRMHWWRWLARSMQLDLEGKLPAGPVTKTPPDHSSE